MLGSVDVGLESFRPRRDGLPLRYLVVLCTPPVTAQGSRYHFVVFFLSLALLSVAGDEGALAGSSSVFSSPLPVPVPDFRSLVKAWVMSCQQLSV